MSGAARLGDPIAHTHALRGLLLGAAVGTLIGISIVGTGGLAAVAVVGGLASAGAGIGEMIGRFSCCTHNAGRIIEGSPNVFINGRPAACASLSTIACDKHGHSLVAQGSSNVYINGMPAARVGDRSTCDGKISAGSSNVFIGGQTLQTEDIASEVPLWLNIAITGLGLGSAVALKVGWRVITRGLAGGFGAGMGGHWLGGGCSEKAVTGKRSQPWWAALSSVVWPLGAEEHGCGVAEDGLMHAASHLKTVLIMPRL